METILLDFFEATWKKVPDRVAVVENNQTITFSELHRDAVAEACALRIFCGCEIRRPIAVFMDKSIDLVLSDAAIIYSGNAYMNLDVKTPSQRVENILKLVEPLCVITDAKHAKHLSEIWPSEKTFLLDRENLSKSDEKEERDLWDALSEIIDTDPLCLINTSGSTGTPKSVALNHRSFIDFTYQAFEKLHIGDCEVIGSLSPAVFDIYSFELCMMMFKACTIVIIPPELSAFPAKILQIMQEHAVSYIFWVPTIMVNIANMDLLSRIPLPDLRTIWFAGEVFPTKQLNYWIEHLQKATFVNLYGPIEITLDCTYFIVNRKLADSEPVPIGIPFHNTDILILNDRGEAVIGEEEGELCVRGSSLALGYYNNPEKTAQAFTQNPLNRAYPELIYRTGDIVCRNERGEIMFKGRKDTLIKHSGYRIELGEIEHVIINTLKIAKNGCAIYDYRKKEIVFYYEAQEERPVRDFRREISAALPNYMIPTRFIWMQELPRNTNGKIDRLKLKQALE